MSEILSILVLRLVILKNKLKGVRQHSTFKIVVVWAMIFGLFFGAFYVPYRAFLFLESMGYIGLVIVDRLLYLFFMGLFVMLIFSNSIIYYSTGYRAQETNYLFTLPFEHTTIYLAKFIDSIILSSWAFLCFLVPIMGAYAWVRHLGGIFYLSLFAFFIPFAVLASSIGCLLTMFLVKFIPYRIYRFLAFFLIIGFLLGVTLFFIKGRQVSQTKDEMLFLITQLIPHFEFTQFAFAPNYWISEGLFKARAADYKGSLFWWFLLVSNALFISQVSLFFAKKIYFPSWVKSAFSGQIKSYYLEKSLVDKICKKLLFLPAAMRSLIIKDIKTFWRDPLQWSQFTIFFGLLAIYFANIRSLGYERLVPFWKNIISFLNLASTNLTLASLAVRFVFPQFSLEGKRFWILGLAPIKMRSLLFEKLWLNSFSSLCISLPLIILSNYMLQVSGQIMFLSIVVVTLMCVSLVSLCVGLGTIFPNFKEDNPAQIVSGFGGTLALVLCLIYICLSVGALAMPFHFFVTGRIDQNLFDKVFLAAGLFVLILSITSIFLSIFFGCRALKRLEL